MFTSRFEFHVVHKILKTNPVEDAVRVDKQYKEVVVPLEILGVDSVD